MPADEVRRTFLREVAALGRPARDIIRDVAHALQEPGQTREANHAAIPPLPAVIADPWLLGHVREALHNGQNRTALGAWFTPPTIVRRLVAELDTAAPATILDPACGGGAFLLAAHERFPDAVLIGIDVDPVAAEAARLALQLAGAHDAIIHDGDGLLLDLDDPVDAVVGNPPFLSQLSADTARTVTRRAQMQSRFGRLAQGYVDEAALFLLDAVTSRVAPGGEVVMVLPEALLGTDSASSLRDAVAGHASVAVVWQDIDGTFPGTPTCALHLTRLGEPTHDAGGGGVPPWSRLLVDHRDGIDDTALLAAVDTGPTIDTMSTATADFRDAYYLLADHVRESVGGESEDHKIVPVGLIDPAHVRWGEASVRFAKRRWDRPVARGLPTTFLDRRLGPKVLLATQTRVLEAVVDDAGDLLPSTPVISLRSDRPWHIGAALTSPVLSRLALIRHAGAGRSRGALKLSAKQVLQLPLPDTTADSRRSMWWDEAAEAYRAAHDASDPAERRRLLTRCGRRMMRAFGVTQPALLDWWMNRLPDRRPPPDHPRPDR